MKKAINNNGIEVEVSDDTIVDTTNGIYYLLTNEREAEEILKKTERDSNALARQNDTITINRRNAYILESDSLFFKSQRGEATEQEWLGKIQEIKERLPYLI